MAENFRNKQWFKNLSQERKDKICKKFNIDEKTLKKAGRETEDGRIVINLLKIDHINTTPKLWIKCYDEFIKNNVYGNDLNWDFENLEDMRLRMASIYCFINPEVEGKWLKYKSTLHNDLNIKDTYKRVLYWVNEAKECLTDKDYVEYCSFQIYSQCRRLFESDLKIIKS
jgi:hypothetical protein